MRARSLSRRERRTITICVSIAAALLLPARVIPAWQTAYYTRSATLQELQAELVRAEHLVANAPAIRDSLISRHERFLALAPRIVSASNASVAAANLAALLSGAAQGSMLRVTSMQARADSMAGSPFIRITVSTDLTGDIRGVASFLRLLEEGPTMVAVRQISITPVDPASPSDRPEVITMQLVAEGIAILRRHQEEAK
jgi:Tfp pilus assembly protein PilO